MNIRSIVKRGQLIENPMNALVIGGTRFFGTHLVRALLNDDANVTILTRGKASDSFGDNVQRLKADRHNPDELAQAVDGHNWDVVLDQICYTAQEARDACRIFSGKTHRYIVTSSESVYGDGPNQKESAFEPENYHFDKDADNNTNYPEAKRQVEAIFAKDSDFDVVMVRPSMVVGVDDYTGRLKWHIDRIASGLPIYFPNINSKMNFIRSDQAGLALKMIGLSKYVGPINCTTPSPISLYKIVSMCENAVDKKANLAKSATDENHSPYGVDSDWSMDVTALKSFGFSADPPAKWMNDLITLISRGS